MRKEQEKLKIELEEAKKRINVDTNRWSFDLYTAQSFTGWINRLIDGQTHRKTNIQTHR